LIEKAKRCPSYLPVISSAIASSRIVILSASDEVREARQRETRHKAVPTAEQRPTQRHPSKPHAAALMLQTREQTSNAAEHANPAWPEYRANLERLAFASKHL
jgi:hypothetical protein